MPDARRVRIAEEFGMPFQQVVRSFARDGESVTATAKMLGYPLTTFRRLLDSQGWRHWFRPMTETVGYKSIGDALRGKCSPARRAALAKARAASSVPYRIELDGVADTVAGHAGRRGIPLSTVYNRIQRGMTPEMALAVGSRRRAASTVSNRNHLWRRT